MNRKTSGRSRLTILAAALLLGLAACGDDSGRPTAPDPSEGFSGRIDVGGYKLQAEIRGTGDPTVVLISGLDVPLEGWSLIQPALSKDTRVVAYDRGGVARSDSTGDNVRTAREIATELEELLAGAAVAPPYILVAHSVAGYYARVYAAVHPENVAGIVLLDAQHELEAELLREALVHQPDLLELIAGSMQFPGSRAEVMATLESAEQARASGSLPRVPIAVVTNLKPNAEAGETAEQRQFWYQMHHEWVEQGSEGLHLGTQGGHMVPLDDAPTALQAIRWVLARTAK